jgi:hypothetical protein
VEGRVLRVADRAVRGGDLQTPRQGCGSAEQLLVEGVADSADRLCDEQRRGRSVEELRDVRAAAAQDPQPRQGAGGDDRDCVGQAVGMQEEWAEVKSVARWARDERALHSDYSGLCARNRSTMPHFKRWTSSISKPTPGR